MYNKILKFWFHEIKPSQWWIKDTKFDNLIKNKFYNFHKKAHLNKLSHWRLYPKGRLAEIILLDQFSRHIYRGLPRAYESDILALKLSQEAIENKVDKEMKQIEKLFLYMPFMHSESIEFQTKSLNLFKKLGLKKNIESAERHFEVIKKFGRFPHRNIVLNRISSLKEIEFLKTPGSKF